MFTGLIRDVGVVRSISNRDGDWRVEVETGLDVSVIEIGASVACSGCCLTVVDKGVNWLGFDVSAESLDQTSFRDLDAGVRVNLEPSLKLGDELGGHIVSGHVDGVAELIDMRSEADSWRLKIKVPEGLERFIASKGSVTLDGISLTVNAVDGDVFGVNIIPHTWAYTSLSDRKIGDVVNIEIDMLARYVARQLEFKREPSE